MPFLKNRLQEEEEDQLEEEAPFPLRKCSQAGHTPHSIHGVWHLPWGLWEGRSPARGWWGCPACSCSCVGVG